MNDQTINLLHDERGQWNDKAREMLRATTEGAAERLSAIPELGLEAEAVLDFHMGWQLNLAIPGTPLHMVAGTAMGTWGTTAMIGDGEYMLNIDGDLPALCTDAELLTRWMLLAIAATKDAYAIELSTQEGIAAITAMPGEDLR